MGAQVRLPSDHSKGREQRKRRVERDEGQKERKKGKGLRVNGNLVQGNDSRVVVTSAAASAFILSMNGKRYRSKMVGRRKEGTPTRCVTKPPWSTRAWDSCPAL